jgi:rhodanese-related sulfurtransferase
MTLTALLLAALALLLALLALARAASAVRRADDAAQDSRRCLDQLATTLESTEQNLRQLLAILAEGGALTRQMVLEGQLYRDVSPEEGLRLVQESNPRILDVRTPQETAAGIIPGAILIPIDDLESRRSELPRDGRKTLVYCAGGGRSAVACEYLSREGYGELYNLEGGFTSWSGPRAKP